jgi:hypothetical protein
MITAPDSSNQDAGAPAPPGFIRRGLRSLPRMRLLYIMLVIIILELLIFRTAINLQPTTFGRELYRLLPWASILFGDDQTDIPIIRYRPGDDPAIGRPAPSWHLYRLDGNDEQIQDYSGKRVRLVFIGKCSSCALNLLRPFLDRNAVREENRIIVTSDNDTGVKWLMEKVGTTVTVLRDRNGATARRYNVAWQPRGYAIDESGTLRQCQDLNDTLARFLTRSIY